MDLVHEKNGPPAPASVVFRLLHDILDLLDATGHRAEIDECRFRPACDDACQRCLANARRAPKDHGRYLIALYELAQHLAGAKEVLLSHKLVKALGT